MLRKILFNMAKLFQRLMSFFKAAVLKHDLCLTLAAFGFVCMFLAVGVNIYAEEPAVPFNYQEHGKRDPFMPLVTPTGAMVTYETDLSVGDLVLQGIVADASGRNAAIINGKIVTGGDTIGSYTVQSVGLDEVIVTQGDQQSVLKLKKGGL